MTRCFVLFLDLIFLLHAGWFRSVGFGLVGLFKCVHVVIRYTEYSKSIVHTYEAERWI